MTAHSSRPASNGSVIPIGVAAAIIMVLLQAISYIAWTVTGANLDRIERQGSERSRVIETQFLRVREHEEFTKRLDAQMVKIENRMNDLTPRTEVDSRLGTNSAGIIQVRNEVDALKRDLGQTYSVKDALKDMQEQIKILQSRQFTPMPLGSPSAK